MSHTHNGMALDQLIADGLGDVGGCILCGSERLEYRAFFVPTALDVRLAVGEPPGETRVIFYGLCDDCAVGLYDPEFTAHIEDVLIAKAQPLTLAQICAGVGDTEGKDDGQQL